MNTYTNKEEDIVVFYLALDINKQLFSILELLKKQQKGITIENKQILFSLRYPNQLKKIEDNISNNQFLSEEYEKLKKYIDIKFQLNSSIRGRTLNDTIFIPDITGMIGANGKEEHDLGLKTILTRPGIDTKTGKNIATILMFDSMDKTLEGEQGHGISISEQINYLQNKFMTHNTNESGPSVIFKNFNNGSNLGDIPYLSKGKSKLARLAHELL